MFNNAASGNFVIAGSEVWSFDADAAKAYFTNQYDGQPPAVTCSGNTTNCAASNQPAAPVAPAPLANRVNSSVGQNTCVFYEGGTLAVDSNQASYTQDVVLAGLNGRGNFRFRFTYLVAVGATNPVDARTAWVLQSADSQAASVSVSGFFAGQSTVKKTGGSQWSFKASHTMTDNYGQSRLVSPVATLLDASSTPVCSLDIATSIESGVDYDYTANAGVNGDSNQLIDGAAVSAIQTGLVSTPSGLSDNFAGNDTALGERAVITGTYPEACTVTAAGTYSLLVSGTLKGVAGTTNVPLSISSNVCVSAGTCSLCP